MQQRLPLGIFDAAFAEADLVITGTGRSVLIEPFCVQAGLGYVVFAIFSSCRAFLTVDFRVLASLSVRRRTDIIGFRKIRETSVARPATNRKRSSVWRQRNGKSIVKTGCNR
jgi:hypothetical protein